MPQASVWQRCACPSDARHPRGACPVLAGFEQPAQWACMPCLTGCGLVIVPDSRQPWKDWDGNERLRLLPGRLACEGDGPPGDADRDGAWRVLSDAYAAGRIDLPEYERRLDAAGAAVSRAGLRAVTADLGVA